MIPDSLIKLLSLGPFYSTLIMVLPLFFLSFILGTLRSSLVFTLILYALFFIPNFFMAPNIIQFDSDMQIIQNAKKGLITPESERELIFSKAKEGKEFVVIELLKEGFDIDEAIRGAVIGNHIDLAYRLISKGLNDPALRMDPDRVIASAIFTHNQRMVNRLLRTRRVDIKAAAKIAAAVKDENLESMLLREEAWSYFMYPKPQINNSVGG